MNLLLNAGEGTSSSIPYFLIGPLALIGFTIVFLIAASILWKKFWRPRQLSRGVATSTFGNWFGRVTKLMFKEDKRPVVKFIPLLKWNVLYNLLIFATFVLVTIPWGSWYLFLIPSGLLVILGATHSHSVFADRHAILTRMFQVANSVFKYGKDATLNPWAYVRIQAWDNLVVPNKVVITVPAEWRSDNPRNKEGFASHFDSVVSSDNIWTYEWDGPKGLVTAEPVPHLPTMADYPGSDGKPWSEIPLGLGKDGPIVWNLAAQPHMLVCGTSGGGKSVLQRNIIFHCIQHADEMKFLGVDLKRVELKPFAKYDEAVLGIAVELEDGVEILRYGNDQMMERYTQMEEQGVNHFNDLPGKMPALLIMVDEAYMFMAPSGVKTDEGKAEDALHGEATTIIGKIARLGRAAGVHLVIATQRPDAKVIYGEIKENLAVRYMAGRAKTTASLMVLDSDAGTRVPSGIKGRGVVSFDGSEEFIQGYFAPQDWIDKWLASNGRGPNGSFDANNSSFNEAGEHITKLLEENGEDGFDYEDMLKRLEEDDNDYSTEDDSSPDQTEDSELSSLLDIDDEEEEFSTPREPIKAKVNATLRELTESVATAEEEIYDLGFALPDIEEATETLPEESDIVDLSSVPLAKQSVNQTTSVSTPKPGLPILGTKKTAPAKAKAVTEWDDELESIFADVPHNTPAKKPAPPPRQLPSLPKRPTLPTKPTLPPRPSK